MTKMSVSRVRQELKRSQNTKPMSLDAETQKQIQHEKWGGRPNREDPIQKNRDARTKTEASHRAAVAQKYNVK